MRSAGSLEVFDEGFPVFGAQQALEFHLGARGKRLGAGEKLVEQFRPPFSALPSADAGQGIRVF